MISQPQKNAMRVSLFFCCCCALIFGIAGIVNYKRSLLNIKHECEIYYSHNVLCRYQCGTVCQNIRLAINGNETDAEPEDLWSSPYNCHTRYCWGSQYVYSWKTMDWRYHPYKLSTDFVENSIIDEDKLHGYVQAYSVNRTEETKQKLNVLVDYINDRSNLSHDQIMNIDLDKYIMYTLDNNDDDIAQFLKWNSQTTMTPITLSTTSSDIVTTLNVDNVNWCDWKQPAYTTYGACTRFPIQWYSLGESESCWTNDACTDFSILSPFKKYDLAIGFGYASVTCLVICVLVLLYWGGCQCYGRISGYNEYARIGDDNKQNPMNNQVFINEQVPTNNEVFIDQQVFISEEMEINNESGRFSKYSESIEHKKCSICLDEYDESDKIIILRCSHHYHAHCGRTWVLDHDSCPLCLQQHESETS